MRVRKFADLVCFVARLILRESVRITRQPLADLAEGMCSGMKCIRITPVGQTLGGHHNYQSREGQAYQYQHA